MAYKDPEKEREYQRFYSALHRPKKIAAIMAWRKANPERHRENQTVWRKANPHKLAEHRRGTYQRRVARTMFPMEEFV